MNAKCLLLIGAALVMAWNPLAGGLLLAGVVGLAVTKALLKQRAAKTLAPGGTSTSPDLAPAVTMLAMSMAGDKLDRFLDLARADLGTPSRSRSRPAPAPARPASTTYFE